jgi:pimeloyl-ACP methyl ester carboxylesterase
MHTAIKYLFLAAAFSLLCLNVFAQNSAQPFRVTKSGKGPQAIILIPGFASSGDVWKETRALLDPAHTCYTFTMAGFAGVPAQGTPSFRAWEKAIAAYLQEQHISKPVIIGHSMGGGLALALAADYPDLAAKIVVVDALPCLSALMNPAFQAKEPNDCSGMVAQVTAMSPEQFNQMQQGSIGRLVADSTHRQEIIGWSLQSDRNTFGQMYCDFLNTDLRPKLASIKCPALILLEAAFTDYKPAIERQYASLPGAQLAYAQHGLHFIMYDDPQWYAAQLKAFIP